MDFGVLLEGGHIVHQGLTGGAHYFLEVLAVVDGDCVAGKRHEGIPCKDFSPGIAREHILLVSLLEVELLGGVLEAVEEAAAGCAGGDFGFIHPAERAGADFRESGREDDGFPFLDVHLEVARHPEVFAVGHAAVHVLDVLDVVVPVRVIDKFRLAGKLHI